MTQWATAAELASLVQRPQVDTVTANLLLSAAADVIRAECQQNIDVATTAEVYDGLPEAPWYQGFPQLDSVLHLRERPATAITSIVETQPGVGAVTLVQGTDFVLGEGGAVYRISNGDHSVTKAWTTMRGGITVTYTHGWATTTREYGVAKQVSLQMAGRAYVNPEGMHQLRVGGYSARYFGTSTPITGLLQPTPFEKLMLAPLRSNQLAN